MRGVWSVGPLPSVPHRKSVRVQVIGSVVALFTPCHGAVQYYAMEKAVAGAWLRAVCADCSVARRVELQADPAAESGSGLRACWADDDGVAEAKR